MGLYWIRPWSFPSLDNNSQVYLTKKLQVPIGPHGPKKRCNSADYLAVMDALEPRFQETSYPVHSYPELSLQSWLFQDPTGETTANESAADQPMISRRKLFVSQRQSCHILWTTYLKTAASSIERKLSGCSNDCAQRRT